MQNLGLGRGSWWRGVLLAGMLALGLWPAAAAAGPRAEVAETTFDFGKIYEDQALSHTFVVKNTGNKTLKLDEVETDCACTVPSFDETIPPGGQGKVTLTVKPYSIMRAFNKKATVSLNDPDRPKLVLALTGYVQPIIEIQPSHIVRLAGTVNDDIKGQVRFISHLAAPWQIEDVKTNIPEMIAVKIKPEQPGKVYVLEVKNLRREPGKYGGIVELRTTSEKRPRLVVRVFGSIYPAASEAR